MKEELIKLETAKLAKEKGFDLETVTYYHPSYGLCPEHDNSMRNYNGSEWAKGYISAPTQALLQKWLREVHGIYTLAVPYLYANTEDVSHSYSVLEVKGSWNPKHKGMYKTYELALEQGLLEALKLIKT